MPQDNQTAIQAWNITTLKAYLEEQIAAVKNETDLKFAARDAAQKLQYQIDQDHFTSLNHEAARILKATEVTVSRDTWDASQKAANDWKVAVERRLQDSLPRSEFQTYKETTDKALTLKAGQSQGFDVVRVGLTFLAGMIVAAAALWAMTKGLR